MHIWNIILCTALHVCCVDSLWRKVGQVSEVPRMVTWWLPGLAVKTPWLEPGGPILALAAWADLENATLTL